MSAKIVTITGGSGFVGQMLTSGLRRSGYQVRIFDRVRGPLVTILRRRYLGTSTSAGGLRAAATIRSAQKRLEPILARSGVLRQTSDDILDLRSRLAARFEGSHAVIHLAGIPHPFAPGAQDEDFRRINYDGSVNVFEAARTAGVPKFVFGSSAQVYRINDLSRIDQLPILESNHLPTPADGQTTYGYLKAEFERYLSRAEVGSTQAIALRMEFPGFRSTTPANLYLSTSIENLVAGYTCALEAPDDFASEAFNLVDAEIDPAIVDVQQFIRARWPEVPNHTRGNESLLSTEKARRLLGYRPAADGTYYNVAIVW